MQTDEIIATLNTCIEQDWPLAQVVSNLRKPETDNNYGRGVVVARAAAERLAELESKLGESDHQRDTFKALLDEERQAKYALELRLEDALERDRKGDSIIHDLTLKLDAATSRLDTALAALRLIDDGQCERLWSKERAYRCSSEPAWTKDAEYTDDRWCDSCIAHEAIQGSLVERRET